MNGREFMLYTFGMILIAAFVAGIIITCYNVADNNKNKVLHMTDTCIEQGYSGWNGSIGCYGGHT